MREMNIDELKKLENQTKVLIDEHNKCSEDIQKLNDRRLQIRLEIAKIEGKAEVYKQLELKDNSNKVKDSKEVKK